MLYAFCVVEAGGRVGRRDSQSGGKKMPEKSTMRRAQRDKREGKAPTTQAGEFVREEMHHIRSGKHGAKNTKQAIAIGLNKARRSGVDLKPPATGRTSEKSRKSAEGAYSRGHAVAAASPSPRRSRAVSQALKREGKSAASHSALSKQAHSAAEQRHSTGTTRRRSTGKSASPSHRSASHRTAGVR